MSLIGKSVIVVGASGTLKDSELGSKIDAFDVVIRINRAKTLGYEIDVGNKIDIWITCSLIEIPIDRTETGWFEARGFGSAINDYIMAGYTDEQIIDRFKSLNEVWLMSWDTETLNRYSNGKDMIRLLDKYKLNDTIKRYEDVSTAKRYVHEVRMKNTTGFIVLLSLSKIYKNFYIAGFGREKMDNRKLFNYYSKEEDFNTKRNIASKCHNYEKEDKWIDDMVNKGIIKDLDKDVDITPIELLADSEYSKSFKCEGCNKLNQKYFWENNMCNYCRTRNG